MSGGSKSSRALVTVAPEDGTGEGLGVCRELLGVSAKERGDGDSYRLVRSAAVVLGEGMRPAVVVGCKGVGGCSIGCTPLG